MKFVCVKFKYLDEDYSLVTNGDSVDEGILGIYSDIVNACTALGEDARQYVNDKKAVVFYDLHICPLDSDKIDLLGRITFSGRTNNFDIDLEDVNIESLSSAAD